MKKDNVYNTTLPIGRWGRLHLDYIKEKYPDVFMKLIESNDYYAYIENINIQAQIRFEEIIECVEKVEGNSLKLLDGINVIAEEIVLEEIIYKTL